MAEERDESTTKESASDTASTDRRYAARVATLVAVPITLVAGAGALAFANSMTSADGGEDDNNGSGTSQQPVDVSLPDLPKDDATICRALVSVLPDELSDSPRRPVTGDGGAAEVAAAWGDPAAVMRCGVEEADVAEDAEVFRLGPACWATKEDGANTVWTTVDRELPIELAVPADHDAPGELAQGLSKNIDEKVPASESAPTGCSG